MHDESTADEATLSCLEATLKASREHRRVVPHPRTEDGGTDLVAGVLRSLHGDQPPASG